MTMPKTFDAAEAEPRIARAWEAENRFAAGANAKPGAETFCIVIPPPNVTGRLHMGHALNNTLQDILARWKRMQGYDVLWQPGQDHAGIATQMVVERQLAETGNEGRREMGREAFVERVWAWKEESGGQIVEQLKRLGASCDWSRNRFTMDDGLSGAVREIFVRLFKEGLIYKDKRLVNWDPEFETAISDLEVEQVTVRPSKTGGKLWRFRYPLEGGATYQFREAIERDEDGNVTEWSEPEERDYIVVATTRPETMLGDTGVAVHPEDERFKDIVGKNVVLPLVGRPIPIVADDYADPTKGAGAVKITPAHDFNDFEVGKRCDLPAINVMTPRAAMYLRDNEAFLHGAAPEDDALALDGLDRYEARLKVVELLDARGLYDGVDDNPHEVPHGDRSNVAIEPYLTDQWFVDAKTLAEPALKAVRDGETVFVPKKFEKTYFNWLEDIQPWCISRQLWWGHRVPVWYGPDGEMFCEQSEEAALAAAATHYGKATALIQDEDVLDTWFSSALWPFSTLGWPQETPELGRYYKTDVLITAFDIIFFWVARMMMAGLHVMKDETGAPEVPFHTVYIHGLVLDAQGQKMSKAKRNVIDPLDLIDGVSEAEKERRAVTMKARGEKPGLTVSGEAYGSDALRFTLASLTTQGQNVRFSEERVAGSRNFGTKLWNAARFLQMNDCAPIPEFDPTSAERMVNRWIIGETARLREACDEALAAYRFNDYGAVLYAHVWRVYCDWFVEFAKPLLQGEDEAAKAETRATAAWGLDQILLMMHPVTPFITEALWELTAGAAGREKPLVHGDWPRYSAADLVDPAAEAEMRWVIALIETVRSVRAELNAPPSAQIPLTLFGVEGDVAARVERNRALIERLARVTGLEIADSAPAGAVSALVEGASVALELADLIDVAAEKARLEKALGKSAKEVSGLEGKLSNEAFLAKAPEEVVEEQRERLAAAKSDAAKLEAAIARLAALG